MKKYAILVEGRFNFLFAKTANAMLRYLPESVVCCIDSENNGKTTGEVMGLGSETPIVDSLDTAKKFNPDNDDSVGITNIFLEDNKLLCIKDKSEIKDGDIVHFLLNV